MPQRVDHVEPVHGRHLHVEEHEVRRVALDDRDRIDAVLALAQQVHALFAIEQLAQARARLRLVVDDQDTDATNHRCGSGHAAARIGAEREHQHGFDASVRRRPVRQLETVRRAVRVAQALARRADPQAVAAAGVVPLGRESGFGTNVSITPASSSMLVVRRSRKRVREMQTH
jgi:hypothetical protein